MEKVSAKGAEIQALPVSADADGRAAKKLMELEAGRALVAQAAKQAEEVRAKLEEEHLEEKEKDKSREQRDTPELSRQSKWFGVEGKLLQEANLRWILEMEQELWEAFLSWYPTPTGDLSKQLEELSRLYLALLEAVLTHTAGQEQTVQKERLDTVLSEKLNLILEVRLWHLMTLLERVGQKETVDRIRYSLYKRVTGENISSQAAERFFSRGSVKNDVGRTPPAMVSQTDIDKAKRSFSAEGSVYQPCGGRSVRINQAFDAQRSSGELELGQRNQALSEAKSRNLEGKLFDGKELVRADAFAKHLSETNDLWERMGSTRGNQEAVGYLSALTVIKGQIYSADVGQSGAMAEPMRSLVNQMVDHYLHQRGAYEVYYYTMNVYEKTKEPQKAAEEGLAYAYRMFLEKKADVSGQKQHAYSQEAGFLQMLEGRTQEEEFRKGARLLEENWRDFLSALGQEGKGIVLRMQRYSPWAALAAAEEQRKARDQKAEQIFLKQALVVMAIVLLYLFWRFFLG